MGTEDFTHIRPVVGAVGDHIRVVGQAWGDPATGTSRVNTGTGDIQPAGLFSTAPYVPPKAKVTCVGLDGTCKNTKRLRQNGLCPGCDMARIKRERAEI